MPPLAVNVNRTISVHPPTHIVGLNMNSGMFEQKSYKAAENSLFKLKPVLIIIMSSHPPVHVSSVQKRYWIFTAWERTRNAHQAHWLMEMFAEAFGVMLYVYFGVGSTAGYVVGNILKIPGLSSVFQIGLAYACGIIFALTVCASTSGGHFNPCITLSMVVFKGFPRLKALRYILAQIIGAYIGCMLVYAQWGIFIHESEEVLHAAGASVYHSVQFTPSGPGGIFALYLTPGQTFPRVFMNEFVNCAILAGIIWACIDPSNILVPPSVAPIVIAIAYAATIWGFSVPGIALNTARDLGGRLMAITIWGTQASGGKYALIASLVNIPATLFGALIYEIFLTDSDRAVAPDHLVALKHHANHRRITATGTESESGEASVPPSEVLEHDGFVEKTSSSGSSRV